jgi:hypothetical protein
MSYTLDVELIQVENIRELTNLELSTWIVKDSPIAGGVFVLLILQLYLPFALFAGLMLKLCPTLLPYFMIVHVLWFI